MVGWETGRSGPDRWGTWAGDHSKANRYGCGDGPTTAGKQRAGEGRGMPRIFSPAPPAPNQNDSARRVGIIDGGKGNGGQNKPGTAEKGVMGQRHDQQSAF